MYLTHLSLTNFRNFARLESDLQPGTTVLFGANAQGKTSLLEAAYYLTSASSPHTTTDRQLINFLAAGEESPFARIVGEVQHNSRLSRIEIRILVEADGSGGTRLRKEVLVNGVKKRTGDLPGQFNAILFLPQDLGVIEGPPGNRRRHLDEALIQADAPYARALADYGKVLTQRNALLKQISERTSQVDELAFWDDRLTQHGANLIRARALAINELELTAAPIHQDLTRGGERLRLVYRPSFDPLPAPQGQMGLALDTPVDRSGVSEAEIQPRFQEALQAHRREEIARGVTTIGPHRDDLQFLVNGIDLHHYGSRGQIRTAMLAVKLAEVDWLRKRTGEWPVLLLDEVLAELDANRRQDVLGRVLQAQQAILTSADLGMFDERFLAQSNVWEIEAGRVTVKSSPSL